MPVMPVIPMVVAVSCGIVVPRVLGHSTSVSASTSRTTVGLERADQGLALESCGVRQPTIAMASISTSSSGIASVVLTAVAAGYGSDR